VRTWLALAALLASLAADARTKTRSPPKKQDPRTVGLGRACKKRVDCKGRGNVCIKLADAHGKEQPQGFCALPCSPLDMRPAKPQSASKTARAADAGVAVATPDAGTSASAAQPHPATPAEIATAAKRKPASRCPPRYQCRSQGAGVPIDLCVKE
jgi:hypothetical protein